MIFVGSVLATTASMVAFILHRGPSQHHSHQLCHCGCLHHQVVCVVAQCCSQSCWVIAAVVVLSWWWSTHHHILDSLPFVVLVITIGGGSCKLVDMGVRWLDEHVVRWLWTARGVAAGKGWQMGGEAT
jgi:hypothetical protein